MLASHLHVHIRAITSLQLKTMNRRKTQPLVNVLSKTLVDLLVYYTSIHLSIQLACLCGRGLVRANRHALSATLGLAVLPSCLRSNRAARVSLLVCLELVCE
jgi:hypothetical protein